MTPISADVGENTRIQHATVESARRRRRAVATDSDVHDEQRHGQRGHRHHHGRTDHHH